ncbi:MAG: hypothetical protein EB060_09340 [Proteobacteria bacterium]|nr:hypothetical protein [Pseudomonadota bacterium]
MSALLAHSDLLGYIAASLTTGCFIPQAFRIARTRHTEGMSVAMYVIFTLGVGMWLIYGIVTGSNPIIASNVCTILLSAFILARLIYLRRSK